MIHRKRASADACAEPPDPRIVLITLVAGTFLAPLSSSIVNIALPVIAAEFDVRLAGVGWVATSYLLTTAALVLVMGRLGDIWGLRRVYVSGFVLFALASVGCAAAGSLPWLLAGRVAQAVGASMMFAAGPALVAKAFPSNRRGWALGWISLSVSAGLTAGPALGGLLLGAFGWPSLFLINVPFAVLIAAGAWWWLPEDCPVSEPFDFAGAVVAASTLTVFLIGLGEIDRSGLFSPVVVGCLVAAALGVALFVRIERRHPYPMLDLDLFAPGPFRAGVIAALTSYMALFAVTFTMPFYLLSVRGLASGTVGLLLTATPVAMALLSPVAGRLSDSWGSRGLSTAGLALLASGIAGLAFLNLTTPVWLVAVLLFVVGAGLSVFQTPNTAAILRAAPPGRVGIGSALVGEARSLGMTLGIAVTAAIVSAGFRDGGFSGGQVLGATEGALFVEAMRPALVVATLVAMVGALISWSRGADRVS
ncbi:MAG: MFS transporter [Actinomycetota bacterium]|nr:MFS transporter [Actinomycetota bacterium]MDZ4179552.1 MFS transporter [Coriobacteriia bacterium]